MLRVKNNDIYFARGETSTLKFEFWTKEGTPYILPANQTNSNLASYADVFTDGDYAKVEYYSVEKVVVSEKILFIRKNENGLERKTEIPLSETHISI